MPKPHPFELDKEELRSRIEEMVDVTCSDLVSEFLIMPSGNGFINYVDFQIAYEVLKRHTASFEKFSNETVINSMLENSRVLGVLRSILGMTAPEWAELARSERNSDITQNAARNLDRCCRQDALFFQKLTEREKSRNNSKNSKYKTLNRIYDLIDIAIKYIIAGAPSEQDGFIHRLAYSADSAI